MRWERGDGFVADDDVARVDLDVVHGFISTSYWAAGISRDLMQKAITGSLNVGVYDADGAQVAYARAATDRATFAWIADVFVLESHRGRGLGKFVVSTLLEHPELQGLRRLILATADAHELYRSYGFDDVADPSRLLTIHRDATILYGQNDGGAELAATPADARNHS
ncbi:GNAT family N-acetyltransferase [Kribbella sp. CA-293567]|uniref:GNAT family N-acetyltransferase n=1 Tax=Kribbella sp. CA-293567 TaxID=3002436 RepID=UPI0022DD51DA|nr:GNAT family N-acetyltransferase [Kribbella sp. CA-293567]WBQ06458.1 GNAT family N-acetyltransferase [Kribbella sp. CA-293567]